MTAFTETWSAAFEQSPADTDNASEGAGKIRGTRIAVQERIEVDHAHAGDADDGKHKKLTLITQSADPTLDANNSCIYTKTTTGLTDVFFKTPLGNAIQLSPRPGTVELTFQPNAQAEWIKLNDGSIGNATSGGTARANADTERLFTLLWNNTTVTECAIQDSAGTPVAKGASAAADYSINRRIVIPIALGRSLAVAGAGAGLTSRALAARTGTETHPLSLPEMPAHSHTDSGHTHEERSENDSPIFTIQPGSSAGYDFVDTGVLSDGPNRHTASATANLSSTGSGTAHNNMQPSVFLNVMMKL